MTAAEYIAGLHRRRAHIYRCEKLPCGCVDSWTCRCYDSDVVTDRYVDGYFDAVRHLLAQGLTPAPNLPAMRVGWRWGGHEQHLARRISELWEVAA
jgi:hypothetical protein